MSQINLTGQGTDSALRRELDLIMDQQEQRGRGIPFYMPVKEIVDAAHRVFADVPRVADYDHEAASQREWYTDAEPVERGELPRCSKMRVHAADGYVVLEMNLEDGRDVELVFDPHDVEGFFLAGLSATRQARHERGADTLSGDDN